MSLLQAKAIPFNAADCWKVFLTAPGASQCSEIEGHFDQSLDCLTVMRLRRTEVTSFGRL